MTELHTATIPRIALRQAAMVMEIDASPKLDPIRVIFQDALDRPGAGMVIVQCYGQAWSAYWGAMGKDVKAFFLSCDAHYIADNLTRGTWGLQLAKVRDKQRDYVLRIVEAVQAAMRTEHAA